jgi:predicted small metal-binding protein
VASCRNPQADAAIAEQMRDLADELNNAHQETAMMHDQLDSLRTAVARQDTLLRQLAGMAGVPVPPR